MDDNPLSGLWTTLVIDGARWRAASEREGETVDLWERGCTAFDILDLNEIVCYSTSQPTQPMGSALAGRMEAFIQSSPR
jgi:hypothetical protein